MPFTAARFGAFALFGALVAMLSLVPSADALFEEGPTHRLQLTLSSTSDGVLQVFYDRGSGIAEPESAVTLLAAGATPHTYELALPSGTYRLFRIDPNNRPGRYAIQSIRIVDLDHTQAIDIPVSELRAAAQATIEATPAGVVVVTTPDANDPQVLYQPGTPIRLEPNRARLVWVLGKGVAAGMLAMLLLALVDVWAQRKGNVGRAVEWQPTTTIVVLGLGAAVLATYPLLLGNSLISPYNGPTAHYYDYAVPDVAPEDTRGTDVASMMWAILPYTVTQRQALAAGEAPLWNRYNAIGRPLWGQGQSFILEPAHLIALAIDEPSVRADVVFVIGRATFAIGAGLAAFAATGSMGGAALVTLAAPFISHFAFRFNHPAYFSIMYAPWILWAYFRLTTSRTSRQLAFFTCALVVASALQLVGSTPKEGIAAFIGAHLTGGLAIALSNIENKRRIFGASAVAGVLTVLLTAPHWLVFLDTLTRASTLSDRPATIFGGWHEIAGLILGPLLPGTPYPGLNGLCAVLAICALGTPTVFRTHRAALACALGSAVCMAISLGVVPADVLMKVPFLGNIQHVWNAFMTAALPGLLVVAAAGYHVMAAGGVRQLFVLLIGGVALIAAIDAGLPDPMAPAIRGGVLASLLPGVTFCSFVLLRQQLSFIALAAAVALTLSAGLLPGGLHLPMGIHSIDAVLLQPRVRVDLDSPPPAIQVIRRVAGDEPFRIASMGDTLFAGVQGYYKLEGILGPDALELPELRQLSDATGIKRTNWDWRTVLQTRDLESARGFLDMLGVRFVFGRSDMFAGYQTVPLQAPDPVQLLERSSPWPRAFFVDRIEQHDTVDEFAARLRQSSSPFASIQRSDLATASGIPPVGAETTIVRARDYHLTANRTTFTVDAPRAGLAVVGEAYVRDDFRATLNGQPVDYMRVNHLFKAVPIPGAGSWQVSFTYLPKRWHTSLVIAVVGFIGLFAVVVIGVAARRV